MKNHIIRSLTMVLTILWAGSCKVDPPASLYDPNYFSGAQPTISALSPLDSALAGVTVVTISGTNFAPDTSRTLVFFNDKRATMFEASTTQLRVRAPNIVKDTVMVKVTVLGSELFSEPFRYKLVPAVSEFGALPNTVEEPVGIACDSSGNVYVSLLGGSGGLGVKKITPLAVRSDFSPPFSTSVNRWTAMKVGPGGFIYAAARRTILFRMPITGGNSAVWQSGGGLGEVFDFDFDQQGNIWAGGNGTAIYRVTPSRNVRAFPFAGNVRSVRVFGGHLYVGGQTLPDSLEKIMRFSIVSSDSLGPVQQYFNFSAAYWSGASKPEVLSVTFDVGGSMFVGTDTSAGSIVLVGPNGTGSEKFYPGLLTGRSVALAYGKDKEMYVSRTGSDADKRIIRINTQRVGAPYFGRQ